MELKKLLNPMKKEEEIMFEKQALEYYIQKNIYEAREGEGEGELNIENDILPHEPPKISISKIEEFRLNMNQVIDLSKKSVLLTDITPLLNLPQKKAASRLKISKSSLSQKFRENTKLKWPYREIRKIDKLIKKADSFEKLQILIEKRNALLRPIYIPLRRYRFQREVENVGFDCKEAEFDMEY